MRTTRKRNNRNISDYDKKQISHIQRLDFKTNAKKKEEYSNDRHFVFVHPLPGQSMNSLYMMVKRAAKNGDLNVHLSRSYTCQAVFVIFKGNQAHGFQRFKEYINQQNAKLLYAQRIRQKIPSRIRQLQLNVDTEFPEQGEETIERSPENVVEPKHSYQGNNEKLLEQKVTSRARLESIFFRGNNFNLFPSNQIDIGNFTSLISQENKSHELLLTMEDEFIKFVKS